ncbi:MAG: hypothetical protein AAFN43_03345 [Pseudomonadota bacterium]
MKKVIKFSMMFLLAAPAHVFVTNTTAAQSFSCANAQIPAEMAICNSEELLVKDEQVADLLAGRLVKSVSKGNGTTVSREHGKWLKTRNTCGNDMDCLGSAYDKRIRSLTGQDL